MKFEGAAMGVRRAFSLLELMIVLVLISVMAGAVVLSFRGSLHNAKLATALSAIQSLDQRMRYAAIEQKRMSMLILDLREGRLQSAGRASGQSSGKAAGLTPGEGGEKLKLPPGVQISKVYVSTREVQSRRLSLPYYPNGSSVGWAVEVSTGDTKKWVLFAGRSGQVYWAKDEDEVSKIFEMLFRRR